MNGKSRKKVDALLLQKTINAAKRRGDDYNGFMFEQWKGHGLNDAMRGNLNWYLFGPDMFNKTVEDLEALP